MGQSCCLFWFPPPPPPRYYKNVKKISLVQLKQIVRKLEQQPGYYEIEDFLNTTPVASNYIFFIRNHQFWYMKGGFSDSNASIKHHAKIENAHPYCQVLLSLEQWDFIQRKVKD
jgi:hypothetical protein